MSINEIAYIIYLAVSFLVGLIPAIIGFIIAAKNKKKAKTSAESEAANKDMLAQAQTLIVAAEDFYGALDVALKAQGESAGPYKKESVMNKLQSYASEKGYNFNIEYWTTKIDEIVKLTKEVNAKK
jgi:hypothetical protein